MLFISSSYFHGQNVQYNVDYKWEGWEDGLSGRPSGERKASFLCRHLS